MRNLFSSIKRPLLAYRRTAVIGAGIVATLAGWLAFDQPPGTKVWDFYTGAAIQSSAAIAPNGMVYFGTDSGKLYAFYPNGRGQWEFPTGDRVVASPAIGPDGTIYFGGYNGIFYAIAPEGVERWRFRANGPIASSAAVGPDGTICFGTLNNRLFALRPDGTKLWDLEASDPVVGSPSVSADGSVYVASSDGVLAAIDLRSGDVKWDFEAPNRILSSPAIGHDGSVYFGCFDGHLYALDPAGKKKWTFATGGPVRGSAVVGPDGTIYFGSDDRQLYALAPDGFKRWTFTVGKWIRSTPAITADGTVYIGSYDHSLYAVGASGVKKWEFVTDENVSASAAVAADGTVYIGSWNGRFYAVRGSSPLAAAGWPRFRGDGAQKGYVGPQTTPAPTAAPATTTVVEARPAPGIVVKQKKGSVLGDWWNRLRGRKSKEVAVASAPRETATPTVTTTTTTVVSSEPEIAIVGSPVVATVVETGTTKVIADSDTLMKETVRVEARPVAPQPKPLPRPVPPPAPSASGGLPMMTMLTVDAAPAVKKVSTPPVAGVVPPPAPVVVAPPVVKAAPTPPAKPTTVTATERDYQPGLLQRVFSPAKRKPREIEETGTTKVIADSDELVTGKVRVETTTVEPTVVEAFEREQQPGLLQRLIGGRKAKPDAPAAKSQPPAAPPKPTEVEAFEREYQPGFFQRMFLREEKRDDSARIVSEKDEVVVNKQEEETVETDSRSAIVKVTGVPAEGTEPAAKPETVRATERDHRPGLLQRMFSSGKRKQRESKKTTTAKVIADSDDLVRDQTRVETTPVEPTEVKPVEPEPKLIAEAKRDRFGAKLQALQDRMTAMRDELVATRQERDELKEQIGSGVTATVVAVPAAKKAEPELVKEIEPVAEKVKNDEAVDAALSHTYGKKLSRLESQLVSLSEELASARVERARLREELATARKAATVTVAAPTVASVPLAPVLPEVKTATPTPTETVIADSRDLVGEQEIPQPEWLKREVRSVIATADPWAQPPGATTPTIDTPAPLAAPAAPAPSKAVAAAPSVVEIPDAPVAEEPTPAKVAPVKKRKPGFFARLFGRGRAVESEQVIEATNVVVVPPSTKTVTTTSRPSDAQLLGQDTGFVGGATQTNFPRVAYSPGPEGSFFTPGAGNLTQLPGFPRQQPVLVPPPVRAMHPTRVAPDAGVKAVQVRESVTVVPPRDAGVTTVDDLSTTGRPIVAIMSPPEGAVLPTPVLDLRGLAQGERRVAQVLVSVNGGPFKPAAGLERWSFQSPVGAGHVLVRVKVVDADGRESEVVARSFGYRPVSKISVEVKGEGKVSPDLNGRELEVGQPYEMTAKPAPGFEFVGWSGGVSGTSPKLVFQMSKDLFLGAEFRPVGPKLKITRSSYTGLLYPRDLLQSDRCGYFEMQVEKDGSFDGQIRLATSAAPLRGRFDAGGRASQTINRPGAPPITIRFTLENGGGHVSGFFDADGVPIAMHGYRTVADGDTLAAITPGRYTLVIPGPPNAVEAGSPAGDGFGEVRIDAGGHVKFSGELPDGTKLNQETRISANGVWPLYVPFYEGSGMLTGWISVTNHPTLDLHGDLRWLKPATEGDRFYPKGFASRRFVFGSIYKPDHDDLTKRKGLAGVLLGGNLGRLVLGQDVGNLPLTSPHRETLQQFDYQIDPNSGRVEGTFIHPETKQPTPFRGMLVQKRGWKSGYFMGADSSGVVFLNGR